MKVRKLILTEYPLCFTTVLNTLHEPYVLIFTILKGKKLRLIGSDGLPGTKLSSF